MKDDKRLGEEEWKLYSCVHGVQHTARESADAIRWGTSRYPGKFLTDVAKSLGEPVACWILLYRKYGTAKLTGLTGTAKES